MKIVYLISDSVNVHWRDEKYAMDNTTSMESVQEFINNHQNLQNLALIQCTSPFIRRIYLKRAVKRFRNRKCIFAAIRSFKLRWKHEKVTDKIIPINFDYAKRPRRQDWNGELLEAGMFYFTERKLLNRGLFQDDT